MRTTLGALVLGLGLALSSVACGGATPAAHAPGAHASAVKAPGQAQIGDRTTCPVSGEEFIVSATSPRVEHDGKTYYFCCTECVDKFRADPGKYAAKPAG